MSTPAIDDIFDTLRAACNQNDFWDKPFIALPPEIIAVLAQENFLTYEQEFTFFAGHAVVENSCPNPPLYTFVRAEFNEQ